MGIISITQRKESLGNLGGTQAAHGVSNTDIGVVNHSTPGIYRATMATPGASAREGMASVGRALGLAIGAVGGMFERAEDRKVDEYTKAMIDSMEKRGRDDAVLPDFQEPNLKHLSGQRRGYYLRVGEGTKGLAEEWDRDFGDAFKKIGDSIDASDSVRNRTLQKLWNYRQSTLKSLASKSVSEEMRMEIEEAKYLRDKKIDIWNDGRTDVLEDIFSQQKRIDDLEHANPISREKGMQALSLSLTSDFIENSINGCKSEDDFKRISDIVKDGLEKQLPDQIVEHLPNKKIDGREKKAILDRISKGLDEFTVRRNRLMQGIFKKAREESIAREVESMKDGFPDSSFYENEAVMAEDVGDYNRARDLRIHASRLLKAEAEGLKNEDERRRQDEIIQGEIDLYRGGVTPEDRALADYYTGVSESLEGVDKRTSLSFLKAAAGKRDDERASKARDAKELIRKRNEDVASNENDIRWGLLNLAYMIDSGTDSSGAQADLCRRMSILRGSRGVTPGFADEFRSSIQRLNNAGMRRAILSFARKCGVSYEQMSDGGYSQSVRKRYNMEAIDPEWAKGGLLGEQFFALSDRLQKSLDELGDDVSRQGAADKVIDELVQEYRANGYKKAIDSISARAYQYQIEQRSRANEEAARSGRERDRRILATQEAADYQTQQEEQN